MALARACREAGSDVSVVYGKISAKLPENLVHTEQAISAKNMYDSVFRLLSQGQDVFISVAAVADYLEPQQQYPRGRIREHFF